MIVYLDGMDFGRTGIGHVYRQLLAGLLERPEVSLVHTLVPSDRREAFEAAFPARSALRTQFVPFGPFSLSDVLRKRRWIRGLQPAPDVHLFPNMNVPFWPVRNSVFTVNDLIMMGSVSSWGFVKSRLFRFLTRRALRHSRGLVCISRFTQAEVEREFSFLPERARVIHPAIDDRFFSAGSGSSPSPALVDGPYLLHVGVRVRHKNHDALLRGWQAARSRQPELKLVVAGRRLWPDDVDRLREELSLGNELIEFQNATDEEILGLYANAAVFVFPSLVEGFGLPPIEAMAMGVPVICSGIPVLRETCGEAAVYVDARDAEAIGEAVCEVLEDASTRSRLITAGLIRSAEFSRAEMVAGYLELLQACAPIGAAGGERRAR